MKPWHEGLPETKHIVVFPPLGRETAFAENKERIRVRMVEAFPDMSFEFANIGLYPDATVMPMCGTAGGPNSRILAPPTQQKVCAIEAELSDCCQLFLGDGELEGEAPAH